MWCPTFVIVCNFFLRACAKKNTARVAIMLQFISTTTVGCNAKTFIKQLLMTSMTIHVSLQLHYCPLQKWSHGRGLDNNYRTSGNNGPLFFYLWMDVIICSKKKMIMLKSSRSPFHNSFVWFWTNKVADSAGSSSLFLITLLRFMISIIYSSPGSKRLIRPNITVVFFFYNLKNTVAN